MSKAVSCPLCHGPAKLALTLFKASKGVHTYQYVDSDGSLVMIHHKLILLGIRFIGMDN